MRKLIKIVPVLFIILALVFVSSCGINNNSSQSAQNSYRTVVNILDPYGNKLYIEGKINNVDIKIDKEGVYIPAKIESGNVSVDFKESLDIFSISSVDVEPGKSITIKLEKRGDGIKIFRKSDGKLMLYAFNVEATPYFSVWLKNKLLSYSTVSINSNQMILAGNWLISVAPTPKGEIVNKGEKEIVKELPVVISGRPDINKIEIHEFK